MHVALIVPAPFEAISGGYAYDRRMLAGLRAAGHVAEVIELGGIHPLADDAARAAARAAWDALGAAPPHRASHLLIDGLALPAFAGMGDALAARGAMALVHHSTTLETGLSEADRARLHAVELSLLPRLARVIVTSEPTAEHLSAAFGVARARIAVVTPGTDDAPRSAGSGGPGCRILSVGALVPRKGHDLLLGALARLFDLDWHLTIVGTASRDRAHAEFLVAKAAELGIAQHVRFAGEVNDAALEALWRSADLFALVSHCEGYGMAMAEAMKRGVPVVVTGVGIALGLVTPENGIAVRPGDNDTLTKGLRRVIFDTRLRRDMAEVAWQSGQRLPSWDEQSRLFAAALLRTD